MGAEVIKIEAAGGDAWRRSGISFGRERFSAEENPVFDIYNTGKKLVSLNLKTPEGKDAIHRLLSQADVFVTNMRPAALHRLGLGRGLAQHFMEFGLGDGMGLIRCRIGPFLLFSGIRGLRGRLFPGGMLRRQLPGLDDVLPNLLHIHGGQGKPVSDAVDLCGVLGAHHDVAKPVRIALIHHGGIENAIFSCLRSEVLQLALVDDKHLGGLALEAAHPGFAGYSFFVLDGRKQE